jgi:hypothetical protein
MKRLFFIGAAAMLFACGGAEKPAEEVVEEEVEEVTIIENKFGDEITDEGALTTVEFIEQFNAEDSSEVKLTAYIEEVCAKKGCWMVLELDEEKTMRVRFKDYGFFVPKDAAGKLATVQGVARMDTTDVATLKHYAEDAGESQEVIDAITEPEYNYAFEAVGVIIKEVEETAGENSEEVVDEK